MPTSVDLVDDFTRYWNAARPESHDRWSSSLGALGQIMLVISGFKPAATSLREAGWGALPEGYGPSLRRAGLYVHHDRASGVTVVAADQSAGGRATRALRYFLANTNTRDSISAELGQALGYPPLAIEAYRGLRPRLDFGRAPVSGREAAAWWHILGCFVAAGDPAGLAEANAWLARAATSFRTTFPEARPPVASLAKPGGTRK